MCDVCNGSGVIEFMINSSDFHYNGDEPIIETEPCEYCSVKPSDYDFDIDTSYFSKNEPKVEFVGYF
jgi:hypothetical protein